MGEAGQWLSSLASLASLPANLSSTPCSQASGEDAPVLTLDMNTFLPPPPSGQDDFNTW
jgi:hypothetical protein